MADPQAPPPRKKTSIWLVLAALLMVALAVFVVLWKVPLTKCPNCTTPAVEPAPVPAQTAACPACKTPGVTVDRFRDGTCPSCKAPAPKIDQPVRSGPCITCKGAGKISFAHKWALDRIGIPDLKFDLLK